MYVTERVTSSFKISLLRTIHLFSSLSVTRVVPGGVFQSLCSVLELVCVCD